MTLTGQIDALKAQLADLPTSEVSTFGSRYHHAAVGPRRSDGPRGRAASATEIAERSRDDLSRLVNDPPAVPPASTRRADLFRFEQHERR